MTGDGLDFEEVTEGSMILVNREHDHNMHDFSSKSSMPFVRFEKGDVWLVESLANRPRVAVIRNLQRGVVSGIRVDALLQLNDKDILTIGPR